MKDNLLTLENSIRKLLQKLESNNEKFVSGQRENEEFREKIADLKKENSQLKDEIKSLRIANTLSGTGDNPFKSEVRAKMNSLIKEIDGCIEYLRL